MADERKKIYTHASSENIHFTRINEQLFTKFQ